MAETRARPVLVQHISRMQAEQAVLEQVLRCSFFPFGLTLRTARRLLVQDSFRRRLALDIGGGHNTRRGPLGIWASSDLVNSGCNTWGREGGFTPQTQGCS